MTDQVFQDAYVRVRARHSDQAWFNLSPREITSAIYSEIRAIDRERTMLSHNELVAPITLAAE